jgi:hypothetical protein
MTQTQITPTENDTCSASHRDRTLALVATASAGLAYLAWRAGGVAMTVKAGDGTMHVGLVSVLVSAAVASIAGLALLRWLERRDPRALRTWTIVATTVGALSLLGPAGATDLSSGLALVSLHLVVGTAVVLGARRMRSRRVA